MLWAFTLIHGLLFGFLVTGYLLLIMVSLSPRIWGYQDYSDAIKRKVPPQTKTERQLAYVLLVPFLLLVLGGPALSVMMLKTNLGGEIPFLTAFSHLLVLVSIATFGDLVILDWLIVSKLTPQFVIIPGTTAEDYKDFSHHYRGHIWGGLVTLLYCLVIATVISLV